jgi:hypothetical protein
LKSFGEILDTIVDKEILVGDLKALLASSFGKTREEVRLRDSLSSTTAGKFMDSEDIPLSSWITQHSQLVFLEFGEVF